MDDEHMPVMQNILTLYRYTVPVHSTVLAKFKVIPNIFADVTRIHNKCLSHYITSKFWADRKTPTHYKPAP